MTKEIKLTIMICRGKRLIVGVHDI
jgi:hypothetical protein